MEKVKFEELRDQLGDVQIALIKDFEDYAITSDGRVWSFKSNKWLSQDLSARGYARVMLLKDGKPHHKRVHRLVASAFIPNPNPDKYNQINHKDEVKTNNDVSNLEWCDAKYNTNYGSRSRRVSEALSIPVKCVELDTVYSSMTEAARALHLSVGLISKVVRGKARTTGGYHFVEYK